MHWYTHWDTHWYTHSHRYGLKPETIQVTVREQAVVAKPRKRAAAAPQPPPKSARLQAAQALLQETADSLVELQAEPQARTAAADAEGFPDGHRTAVRAQNPRQAGPSGVAPPPASAGETAWLAAHRRQPLPADTDEARRVLAAAEVGARFAVYDVPDGTTELSDDAWRASVLERTAADRWTYYDVDGTSVLEQQAHDDEDHGLLVEVGMYVRAPTADEVAAATPVVAAAPVAATSQQAADPPRRARDALPDGWVVTEHLRSGGVPYKRFRGPNGERAQSYKEAWRMFHAATEGASAEAQDAIDLGDATFVRATHQPSPDPRLVDWTVSLPWHDELRVGATLVVPVTEGLCACELVVALGDVRKTDPVQLSVSAPPPPSSKAAVQPSVTAKGVRLLPAPEEEQVVPDGMWAVDRAVDARTKPNGKMEILLRWKGAADDGQPWPDSWEPEGSVTPDVRREARIILQDKAAAEEEVEPEIERKRRANVQRQQELLHRLGLDKKRLHKDFKLKRTNDGRHYAKPSGRAPKGKRWDAVGGEWVEDAGQRTAPSAETEGEQVERTYTETHGAHAHNIVATQLDVVAESWEQAQVGFDTRTAAANNATELLVVRAAQEDNDEVVAQVVAADDADAHDAKQPRHRAAPTRYQAGQGAGLARHSSSQQSQPSSQSEATDEGVIDDSAALDVAGLVVGDVILAKGLSPTGERAWFQAKILKLRTVYPPIVIKYIATAEGITQPLLLPTPRTAYVHRGEALLAP